MGRYGRLRVTSLRGVALPSSQKRGTAVEFLALGGASIVLHRMAIPCMSKCWCALLLAVLTTPAAGKPYNELKKCPLMKELLQKAESNKGMVLDVGANGGCEMTTALRHGRHVIGVECLKSAYDELLSTPHIAGHPNATLLHVCASNSTGMAELNLASDSSSLIEANLRGRFEARKVPQNGPVREPVVLVPLDELLPPSEHVAVIKVDVQGAEYNVLQGLQRTITRDHPVIGYEDDVGFEKRGNVAEMLKLLGYVCHARGLDQVCH